MRRAFIVFIFLCLLFTLQTAYGAENSEQWEAIKKVSHGKETYSVMINQETKELSFWKEERDKSERKVIYQTSLGVGDDKTKANISVKKDRLFIILSQQKGYTILRVDEPTGEIKKQVELPFQSKKIKKPKKSKSNQKAQSLSLTEEKPEAPSFISVKTLTTTSTTIRWNTVIGATEYKIYSDIDKENLITSTSATTYTMDDLEPDEVYVFYVTAVHESGESDAIPAAVITPAGDYIDNISITNSQDNIKLAWSSTGSISSFGIHFWDSIMLDDQYVTTEDSSYTINGLEPLTMYAIDFGALNGKYAVDSALVVAMTYPPVPNPPKDLSTEDSMLQWEKSDYATEYRIYNGTTLVGNTGTNQNTFQLEGLEVGKTYDFYVAAKNIAGTSTKSHIEVTGSDDDDALPPDLPDPPEPTGDLAAPQGFNATDVKQESISLSWQPVDDAIGYVLWVNGEKRILLGDVQTYQLLNLLPNKWYELHLRAVDKEDKEGKSSVLTIRTLPLPPDPPVVKIDKITSISAFLSWEPAPRATKYTISYQGNTFTFKKPKIKIKGLEEKQKYVFNIISENRGGKSQPVEVVIETIPLSFDYIYDGLLLDYINSSYEQEWDYSYNQNGNTTQIVYIPTPKQEAQEFDIKNPQGSVEAK